ncbi:hypothetical protein HDU67_001786, partial [Dinochytrium kinnereticum]
MSYFSKHTPAPTTDGSSSSGLPVHHGNDAQPHAAPVVPATAAEKKELQKELVQAAAEFVGGDWGLEVGGGFAGIGLVFPSGSKEAVIVEVFGGYGTIQTAGGHVDKLTTISLAFGLALTTGV